MSLAYIAADVLTGGPGDPTGPLSPGGPSTPYKGYIHVHTHVTKKCVAILYFTVHLIQGSLHSLVVQGIPKCTNIVN